MTQVTLRRSYFNMIEVVLAITVLAVGIMSVIALIPIARLATRDNIAQNYSTDAAEMLLNHISTEAKGNWAGWIQNNGGFIKKESETNPLAQVDDFYGHEGEAEDPITTAGATFWNAVPAYEGLYQNDTEDNLFRLVIAKELHGHRTRQFDALMRVWKSPITTFNYSTKSKVTDTSYAKGAQINIEVLWPTSAVQADRSSAIYTVQIYNPN